MQDDTASPRPEGPAEGEAGRVHIVDLGGGVLVAVPEPAPQQVAPPREGSPGAGPGG
jgi:hypothetical protein